MMWYFETLDYLLYDCFFFPSIVVLMIMFTEISEKRTVSPHRFPLLRSGSLSSKQMTPNSSRPTTPNSSRPITPNPSNARRRVSIGSFYLNLLLYYDRFQLNHRNFQFINVACIFILQTLFQYLYPYGHILLFFIFMLLVNWTLRLSYIGSILLSLGNQLQCGYTLKKKIPKRLISFPAKVNVFSRPCLADANQRKMTRYTHTWMNTKENWRCWKKKEATEAGKSFCSQLYFLMIHIYVELFLSPEW